MSFDLTSQANVDLKVPLYEELDGATPPVPAQFEVGYNCLGNQEIHRLKYIWELTICLGSMFPFINDLFTDRRFIVAFTPCITKLGRINMNCR